MIKQFFSSRFKYFGAEKIDNYNALHVEGEEGGEGLGSNVLKIDTALSSEGNKSSFVYVINFS